MHLSKIRLFVMKAENHKTFGRVTKSIDVLLD